jgi:arylsulfatase A-like enzyme
MRPSRLARRLGRGAGRRLRPPRSGGSGEVSRRDLGVTAGPEGGPRVLLLVIDGLRPDSVSARDTPVLERLRREGVWFDDARAVVPTGTRVNAAAISTGSYPKRNGVLGNAVVLRDLGSGRPVSTRRQEDLERAHRSLEGGILSAPTLAGILADRGRSLVALSSASTGSAWLLAPDAASGTGAIVNGAFERGTRTAYPDELDRAIHARFGPAPRKARIGRSRSRLVRWTHSVLTDLVLTDLRPDVAIEWICEPDHTQHAFGVGSPQARRALAEVDALVGEVVARMESLGLADRTDLLVLSDHGAVRYGEAIDVEGLLLGSGLKRRPGSDDVIVAPAGPSVQLSVDRPERVEEIVGLLQRQSWCGALFSRWGGIAGTFPLELVQLDHPTRACDLLITFRWDDRPNEFGVPGTEVTSGGSGRRLHSGHGGASPYAIRTTFLGRGPSFREGHVVSTPVGHVDVVPTILELLGESPVDADGRLLAEALRGRPVRPSEVQTMSFETADREGSFRAALQLSVVDGRRYLDAAGRVLEDPRVPSSAG